MFFYKTNENKAPLMVFRMDTLTEARQFIIMYRMGTAEQILDAYTIKEYNTPLKSLCIYLLDKTTFMQSPSGDIVVTFKDNKDDQLASLITYGNETLPRSNILRLAIGDFDERRLTKWQ